MTTAAGTAEHWDGAYTQSSWSWFQHQPHASLHMLDAAGITPGDSVIDVGGGASPLVDALLDRGYTDVTVLDISAVGLRIAQRRIGTTAEQVHWFVADLLIWQPQRTYAAWHDRAVLHFLTTSEAQDSYLRTLHAATTTGSTAIFGCFAPDGPQQCSGLLVARYSPTDLVQLLSQQWTLIAEDYEKHHTPSGATQPFTWAALRRQP